VTLIFLAIGLVAGVLAGTFGIGGGIIVVPSLVIFAKMSQKTATGTSLGALLLPVGLLGLLTYWRAGEVDIKASLFLALGMFVGAYGGSLVAAAVSDATLKRAFALFLVAMAARLWFTAT
jgi:uncharacterized membrane protein YfcA